MTDKTTAHGASGHGKVVADAAESTGSEIIDKMSELVLHNTDYEVYF